MDRVGMFVLYLMQCAERDKKNEKNEFCGRKIEIVKFLLVLQHVQLLSYPSIVAKRRAQLLVTLLFGFLLIQLRIL